MTRINEAIPYHSQILSTRKGDVAIRVTPCEGNTKGESKVHSPEEISFYILRYMKVTFLL